MLILMLPSLVLAHPISVQPTEIYNYLARAHNESVHVLHPRDSVTIEIKSSFTNSTVSNTSYSEQRQGQI